MLWYADISLSVVTPSSQNLSLLVIFPAMTLFHRLSLIPHLSKNYETAVCCLYTFNGTSCLYALPLSNELFKICKAKKSLERFISFRVGYVYVLRQIVRVAKIMSHRFVTRLFEIVREKQVARAMLLPFLYFANLEKHRSAGSKIVQTFVVVLPTLLVANIAFHRSLVLSVVQT